MCSTLLIYSSGLEISNSVALWVEGIALVLIFGLELKEYKRQGRDKKEQHEEWVQQMAVMQSQANASETAANAAKKSAEVAEMALKLAERADVLLDAASLTVDPTVARTDGPINPFSRVSLQLKNFGRTHARNVVCRIGLVIPGVPEIVLPTEPIILGPGATQLVLFNTFSATLTKRTYEDIANGVVELKFSGGVTYEDIFGESHGVACRGLLDPKAGRFILGDTDPRKKADGM